MASATSATECSIVRAAISSCEYAGVAITGSGIVASHVLSRHAASACVRPDSATRRHLAGGYAMRPGRVAGVSVRK